MAWSRVLLMMMLVAAAMTASTSAVAHKRFARKEGALCKECHVSPEGGGPRTTIGQYYQATGTLPVDRSDEGMQLVHDTVERWLTSLLAVPPTIRWRYTPPSSWAEASAVPTTDIDDAALLRRLSLDLRGTAPTLAELERLQAGTPITTFVDEFIASPQWSSTFHLYHMDLVRPRRGIFRAPPSLTRLAQRDDGAWSSERLLTEQSSTACNADQLVEVSPWWARDTVIKVCAWTASTATTAVTRNGVVACGTRAGQESGACGCGTQLRYCYIDGLERRVVASMVKEMATVAMTVVDEDRPYGEVLTADWTMVDGWLAVHYAMLWGELDALENPDARQPWHRIERRPEHSGVLSSPAMLGFFYNGRRWAQRTFETFMCHETVPDWDLLDDAIDSGDVVAVPYRDSPDLLPSQTVTEGRACAACHIQLDGLSRVKDRWGYFGDYNEVMPVLGMPIPQQAVFLGDTVDGLDGFGKALARSDVFLDCAVNQVWEHMVGHRFRADEVQTRRALLRSFEQSGQDFKQLVRSVATSTAYRAQENLKLMTREQYKAAMQRVTDVEWRVINKNGWDTYYDKVGGMDYRRIESRDRRPGIGHSLVQFKGALESCDAFVTVEGTRARDERLWLDMVDNILSTPDDATLDAGIARLYARALARPWAQVDDDERGILRTLFHDVESRHGPDDGWRAVCAAVLAAEDYAVY